LILQKSIMMDHLPGKSPKFQKRLLIVWASAILWIYFGNIINFHQHHIWGKQLIPVAATSNRTKEKFVPKGQGLLYGNLTKHFIPGLQADSFGYLFIPEGIDISVITPAEIQTDHSFLEINSLRAPPLA
jgi:hypothetical protein